jgi:hypothetical protein
MREADLDAVIRILDALIEDTTASLPEGKREKFLEELPAPGADVVFRTEGGCDVAERERGA